MYGKFKVLLEEAELLGKVVAAYMRDTHANIEIIDDNGKRISLNMTIEEE